MGKSLSLPELIGLNELQAIQDSIAKTVGISSVISSPDGEPLTRFSYPTGFCSLIQSTEEGKRRCLLSFKEMSEKALALKKPTIRYCFAHCAHFVAPIIINGEHKGTMFAGQFTPQKFSPEHLKELEETAAAINLDPQLLTEEAKKMRVIEEEVVRSYSSLLFQIVEAIARQEAQATVLQQAHDELETRVQKRTAELAMSTEELKQEIRRRKQVEETLRQNEERYRLFFDSIPDGVVVVDTKGIIVECSRSATLLYKRLREELIGRHITEFLAPASVSTFRKDFPRVQQGETIDGEIQIVRGDGSIIDVWRMEVPLKDADGNIAGVLSYSHDITERKRADDEVKESRGFLAAVIENIPDPIYIKDRQFRFAEVNNAFLHRHKVAREEIIGKTRFRETDAEIFKTGRKLDIPEQHYADADGNQHGTHIKKVPLTDESGEITHVLTISRDITERKRAEEQIKASLNEKEVLLKEIHHRVKNNMQVIISLLNLQSKHVKDKHDLEIFKDSQNRVKSMALIHEELYQSEDLARIDFAEYVQNVTSHLFSLYSVSTAVIKLSINIKDVLLDINTAIPCGLIINELVSNSLKYAFPDGREGEIQIKLYASKDDTFSLIVRDNGIGLPEDLDFRDTESLGLQLVTTLVEQLECTIELDRSEGTAFKVVFEIPK